jgi:serine-type D-Ala-D-Ala carboxypeptidase (penicillin-binding protein 5/6)
MRVIKRRRKLVPTLLTALLLLGGYSAWTLLRPLPLVAPQQLTSDFKIPTPPSSLAWPASQSAVGILGTNILETHGTQTPVPTASTAKLITCLVILDKKPLDLNQTGPLIAMTNDDVTRYVTYLAQDGSVLPVKAGEQLSQYQALQAILLPSANNMADSLAIWAYGSLPAYATAANKYLARHGIANTHVGSDASGLSPDTTSTARDMVKIGRLAMDHPVISQIVRQPTASGLPVVDTIRNVNFLLGTDNIIGIKTGTSDQAGGAFVGAATVLVNNQPQIIITAVLKAASRQAVMRESQTLIKSAQANFKPVQVAKAGQIVGNYRTPWGNNIKAVATRDLSLSAWQGSKLVAKSNLQPISEDIKAGQVVGSLSAAATELDVKLQKTPTEPSAWWRLTHPFD